MELRRKCPSWPFRRGFALCTLHARKSNLFFTFILLWASAEQRLETVQVLFFCGLIWWIPVPVHFMTQVFDINRVNLKITLNLEQVSMYYPRNL